MRFVEAKTEREVVLDGIEVEIDTKDGGVTSVTLRDAAGHVVRIQKDGYSGLDVLIPAPPVIVKRYRLAGRIPGVNESVLEYHEYEHQAKSRRDAIDAAVRVEHSLTITEVAVPEEEAESHPANEAELDAVGLF